MGIPDGCQAARQKRFAVTVDLGGRPHKLSSALLSAGLARLDGAAVRFSPRIFPDSWTDTVSGKIAVTTKDHSVIDGLVLVRSDGMPTYHFASVADDMALGITLVVRGIEHMPNTAKHVALWNALAILDWPGRSAPLPQFSHVGLITQGGKKVSKRDGSASLLDYRDRGVDPDALFNWLLRLGWGPTVDDKTTKTISRSRAIDLFLAGGRLRPSPANMDLALLDSLDRKYKGGRERADRAALKAACIDDATTPRSP